MKPHLKWDLCGANLGLFSLVFPDKLVASSFFLYSSSSLLDFIFLACLDSLEVALLIPYPFVFLFPCGNLFPLLAMP